MTDIADDSIETRLAAERLAVENCDVIRIHDIGYVQPVGFLLATDPTVDVITHVSDSVTQFVRDVDVSRLLGAAPADVLGKDAVHGIRNAAGHSTIGRQREYVTTTSLALAAPGYNSFDISAYGTDEHLIIECLPHVERAENPANSIAPAQRILSAASNEQSIEGILSVAVEQLRRFSGYDRVKAYRFLPGGAGEVCTESRTPGVDSFLGLRFPAFDIPASARELYKSTPIRVISSVDSPQSAIVAADPTAEPLDLSLAVLRGCVPVHTQYLSNMGVRATMSLPIVVDGEMWGLVAFHHHQDRCPDTLTAMGCELVGQSLSMMIEHVLHRDDAWRHQRAALLASTMFVIDDTPEGFGSYWENTRSALAQLIECDGVAMVGRLDVLTSGDHPPIETIRRLLGPLTANGGPTDRSAIALTSFAEHLSVEDVPVGGALVLMNPIPFVDAIMFFRNPLAQNIRWAGKDDKDIEETEAGLRLVPRASFAEYVQSLEGECEAWSADDLRMADALQQEFARVHSTGELQAAHRERLGLMVRELNHRVRNILALVSSLMRQSEAGAASVSDYVDSLGDRISALAEAHDLLTENQWRPVQLSEILHRSLRPYLLERPDRIDLEGPGYTIAPDVAHVLVLVVHELASNAAKYGSLSVHDGTVSLRWEPRNDGVAVRWVERGGPVVSPDHSEGLGTSIIRNALVFEFNAESTLTLAPEGAVAEFVIPATVASPAATPDAAAVDLLAANSDGVERLRVLIVEDDFLIARETMAALDRFGVPEPHVVASVGAALQALDAERFDLVLLDANLRGEFSGPVATALAAAGTPFVFVTGYGSRDQELKPFAHRRILTKPLRPESLLEVLNDVVHEATDLPGSNGDEG